MPNIRLEIPEGRTCTGEIGAQRIADSKSASVLKGDPSTEPHSYRLSNDRYRDCLRFVRHWGIDCENSGGDRFGGVPRSAVSDASIPCDTKRALASGQMRVVADGLELGASRLAVIGRSDDGRGPRDGPVVIHMAWMSPCSPTQRVCSFGYIWLKNAYLCGIGLGSIMYP